MAARGTRGWHRFVPCEQFSPSRLLLLKRSTKDPRHTGSPRARVRAKQTVWGMGSR